MRSRVRKFLTSTWIGQFLLIPIRFYWHAGHGLRRPWLFMRWLLFSRELGNVAYALTDDSKKKLIGLVADVSGRSPKEVQGFFTDDLRAEFERIGHEVYALTRASPFCWIYDARTIFDQRLIYFLLVRALKPKLIFQSGTERGLGACLISLALEINESEGTVGRLITTELDPKQGFAIPSRLRGRVTLIHGDTNRALDYVSERIDLYIHDSAAGVQAQREFGALVHKVHDQSVIVSTWHSEFTRDYAANQQRAYRIWQDTPSGHWYPGARMAVIGGVEASAKLAGGRR